MHDFVRFCFTQVFDGLKSQRPSVLGKVIPVIGDIMQPQLGLSQSDLTALIENVTIVYHSAASVRFDEPLRYALHPIV